MKRTELERYLKELLQYEKFEDFCHNGLQVEGKEDIRKIAFGVSFHLPFVEDAIRAGADALFVHHGIFGKNLFSLTGTLKQKIAFLLHHDISLFGVHLPLDAHEPLGNNAQLLSYVGADIVEPFEVGFLGRNTQRHSLTAMLDIFHQKLQPEGYQSHRGEQPLSSVLTPKYRHDFLYFDNGPEIPETFAVISGGASRDYRPEIVSEKGIDTYICGSVDEHTPATSYETSTNFANIGHYWSEKAGVLALQAEIERQFDVETVFLAVENVI